MPSIKGLINEDDSRCLGTYLGDFSSDHISKALTNAEQVILIGVEDFEMAWTSFKPFSGKSGWSLKTELMERGKKVLTVDCDKYRLSLDDGINEAVNKAFVELHRNG